MLIITEPLPSAEVRRQLLESSRLRLGGRRLGLGPSSAEPFGEVHGRHTTSSLNHSLCGHYKRRSTTEGLHGGLGITRRRTL